MITRTSMFTLLSTALLALGACGSDARGTGDDGGGDDGGGDDGGSTDGGGTDGGSSDAGPDPDEVVPTGCRAYGDPDRKRFAVIARPYGNGVPAVKRFDYEVLDVAADGSLSRFSPPKEFSLGGRGLYGNIQFTPDGSVGLVAFDEGGGIGSFRLDADGNPTVVHMSFDGLGYPGRIVLDPSGERLYVVDRNWRNNGGGIYAIDIACDGTLTDRGLVIPSKSAGSLVFRNRTAFVSATDIGDDQTETNDVYRYDWSGASPVRTAATNAFVMGSAIVSGGALTADGKTYLVGDANAFSVTGNRVIAVDVGTDSLTLNAEIASINDPQSIIASPFGNVAAVTAVQGNAIFALDNQGVEGTGPWRKRGIIPTSSAVRLPTDMVQITRGALRGHFYVVENETLRHMRFLPDGNIVEADKLNSTGADENDFTMMMGQIGIQP